jgi:hypothetical protein
VRFEHDAIEARHDSIAAAAAAAFGSHAPSTKLCGAPSKMIRGNAFAELGGTDLGVFGLKARKTCLELLQAHFQLQNLGVA